MTQPVSVMDSSGISTEMLSHESKNNGSRLAAKVWFFWWVTMVTSSCQSSTLNSSGAFRSECPEHSGLLAAACV